MDGTVKIVTVLQGEDERWVRMHEAFKTSLHRNCPAAGLVVRFSPAVPIPDPGDRPALPPHLWTNTAKLEVWEEELRKAKSGEQIVFMDTDTVVLGELSDAFRDKYDVGITCRQTPGAFPYAGGVVFVRANSRSRRFFAEWVRFNRLYMQDRVSLKFGIRQYGGVNQLSLHQVIDMPHGANLAELPCDIWNCCAATWGRFGDKTRVLHVHSKLRRVLFGDVPVNEFTEYLLPCVEAWRVFDQRRAVA